MEMFLGWFDDTAKKPIQTKIAEAVERFTYKFGFAPDVCLVHEGDEVEMPGVTIRPARHIRHRYFWVGREDISGVLPPAASEPARDGTACPSPHPGSGAAHRCGERRAARPPPAHSRANSRPRIGRGPPTRSSADSPAPRRGIPPRRGPAACRHSYARIGGDGSRDAARALPPPRP